MALSWIIDGILLLIFALIVFLAMKRGFLKVVLSLACWVFSLLIAGAVSVAVARPVYDAVAARPVRSMIATNIDEAASGSDAAQYAAKVLGELPNSLRELADYSGLPAEDLLARLDAMPKDSQTAAELLETAIVAPMAIMAIRLLLSIIIFVVLLIITRLIASQLEKAGKLPVIKQANKVLGAALGVVKGLVVLFVLCLLLRVVGELGDGDLAEAIREARLPALLGLLPLGHGL